MNTPKYKAGDIISYEAHGCPKNHFLITGIVKETRMTYSYIMLESGRVNKFDTNNLEALTKLVA